MSEFLITGPGRYRTRDRRIATIDRERDHHLYKWEGTLEGSKETWMEDGCLFCDQVSDGDIIGLVSERVGQSVVVWSDGTVTGHIPGEVLLLQIVDAIDPSVVSRLIDKDDKARPETTDPCLDMPHTDEDRDYR